MYHHHPDDCPAPPAEDQSGPAYVSTGDLGGDRKGKTWPAGPRQHPDGGLVASPRGLSFTLFEHPAGLEEQPGSSRDPVGSLLQALDCYLDYLLHQGSYCLAEVGWACITMLAALVTHGDGQRIEATLWDKLLEVAISAKDVALLQATHTRRSQLHSGAMSQELANQVAQTYNTAWYQLQLQAQFIPCGGCCFGPAGPGPQMSAELQGTLPGFWGSPDTTATVPRPSPSSGRERTDHALPQEPAASASVDIAPPEREEKLLVCMYLMNFDELGQKTEKTPNQELRKSELLELLKDLEGTDEIDADRISDRFWDQRPPTSWGELAKTLEDHAKKLVASLLPKCCASTQPGEALFPNLGRELKASLQPFLGTKKILLKKLVDKWVVTKGPKEDDLRKVDLCVRTVEYKRKDHYECLVFEKGEQTKPQEDGDASNTTAAAKAGANEKKPEEDANKESRARASEGAQNLEAAPDAGGGDSDF